MNPSYTKFQMPSLGRSIWSILFLSITFVFGGGILKAQEVSAGGNLVITSIHLSEAGEVTIAFRETGDGYAQHIVESIIDLGGLASAWDQVDGATVQTLGDSTFEVTFPYGSLEREFFRLVGIGTAGDTDGDGLNTAEEALLGTNDQDPDSDDDGFSDGLEASLGTDPLDGEDVPPFSNQPNIRFALVDSVVNEGDGELTLEILAAPDYEGNVQVEISVLTNADDGGEGDFSIARSSVALSGTNGFLTIGLIDDAKIENIESIVIDLIDDGTGNYHLGAVSQHIVSVIDNDSLWTGAIRVEDREYQLRMRMIREGSDTTGAIISSLSSDSETGIQGGGSIPEGEWPLTISWLENTFDAESVNIPMASTLLFDGAMNRKLHFSVVPPEDPENPAAPYIIEDAIVAGAVTDTLSSEDPNFVFFNQKTNGVFYLVKDIPVTESIDIPFETEQ